MRRLENQVVLITGCTSGIGEALALAFGEAGHTVFATARNPAAISPELLGCGAHPLRLDVTDPSSVHEALDTVLASRGRIDMVVNNAGFLLVGPSLEIPADRIRSQFEVNVFGPVAVSQAVFPHLVRQGSGRIVNVGSTSGAFVTPYGGIYGGSKAALGAITEAMRLEAAPFGVEVILVLPGAVRSRIAINAGASPALIPGSLYAALEDGIRRRADMTQENPTPARVFAKRVVAAITRKPAPRIVRAGRGARLFAVLPSLLPAALLDRLRRARFGIPSRPTRM